jgi:hypothetical protein
MRRKLLRNLSNPHGPLFERDKGGNKEIVLDVIATLWIIAHVPEVDLCFNILTPNEAHVKKIVWRRFFTADGCHGYERTKLSSIKVDQTIVYGICDRKKLMQLIDSCNEILFRFDQPVSPP